MAQSLFLQSFLLALALFPSFSVAYSWHFSVPPTQCSNLSIAVTGSGGIPPYRVLIVPFGPSTLSSHTEVRSIIDQPFDGSSTTVEFPINYPANSHFIAVVSDASGFGTGGTSVATLVAESNDASCFDSRRPASPLFPFYISPDAIYQCQQNRLWWNSSEAQGTPKFHAVIPGGQSFSIAVSNVTDVSQEGRGFSWVPPIRVDTVFLIVGGDLRGMGTAGSAVLIVQQDEDSSCLDDTSPSSTVGTPAGWIQPTAHIIPAPRGPESGSVNAAIIAGATVGSVLLVALATLLFLFMRRRRRMRLKPRVLIDEIDDDFGKSKKFRRNRSRNDLPECHRLEPFPLLQAVGETDMYSLQESEVGEQRYSRRGSAASSSTSQSLLTVKTSYSDLRKYEALGYTKGPIFEQESSLSFFQHEDAGPSRSADSPVELPPAYARNKRASIKRSSQPLGMQ